MANGADRTGPTWRYYEQTARSARLMATASLESLAKARRIVSKIEGQEARDVEASMTEAERTIQAAYEDARTLEHHERDAADDVRILVRDNRDTAREIREAARKLGFAVSMRRSRLIWADPSNREILDRLVLLADDAENLASELSAERKEGRP